MDEQKPTGRPKLTHDYLFSFNWSDGFTAGSGYRIFSFRMRMGGQPDLDTLIKMVESEPAHGGWTIVPIAVSYLGKRHS